MMQEELDNWMPQDTATMYKNLLKKLKKNKKEVWGRDIFNNRNLSFEPNMNMALPANYRLGPAMPFSLTSTGLHRNRMRQQ